MDDLSILESNGEATYTYQSHYKSLDISSIIPGFYNCNMRYGNLGHYQPFSVLLNQEDGRVWVGHYLFSSKKIMIE